MKEPTESDIQRVSFVLSQFVRPWGLPLNPENLDLMAYCALKYGLESTEDWPAIQSGVAEEVRRDKEAFDRMLEAMRRSSEGAQ